ncbi:MAG: hypothetical protein ACKOET_17880 [Verrucomicrobiota bacterium]
MNRSRPAVVLALAAAVLFFLGLRELFQLRFAAGDIYPPGSSRRADPVGSRALHDSFALLPGHSVQRGFERPGRLPDPPRTTLFLLGVPIEDFTDWSADVDWAGVEALARAGARVVIGLLHESRERTNRLARARGAAPVPAPVLPGTRFQPSAAWGVAVARETGGSRHATGTQVTPGLPATLPWPGATVLDPATPAWRTWYQRAGQLVVIERPLGSGSLVLLASDYLASNEGLRRHRQPGFLAWLAGDRPRLVFDETHLGLSRQPGIAGLVRQYRLGGAAAGFLLLAGLAVWRQMTPFNPPPAPAAEDAAVVPGKPAAAGLGNILRRSVDRADLLSTCFALWQSSAGRSRHLSPGRRADLQDVVNLEAARPARQRDPLAAYRRLAEILRQR